MLNSLHLACFSFQFNGFPSLSKLICQAFCTLHVSLSLSPKQLDTAIVLFDDYHHAMSRSWNGFEWKRWSMKWVLIDWVNITDINLPTYSYLSCYNKSKNNNNNNSKSQLTPIPAVVNECLMFWDKRLFLLTTLSTKYTTTTTWTNDEWNTNMRITQTNTQIPMGQNHRVCGDSTHLFLF